MKKTERWKEQMVSALEIPADLAYSETIITMTVTFPRRDRTTISEGVYLEIDL